jgi:hypothetical protein
VQENHLFSIGKSAAMICKFKRKKFPFLILLQENCNTVVVLAKNPQAPPPRQAPYMMASM